MEPSLDFRGRAAAGRSPDPWSPQATFPDLGLLLWAGLVATFALVAATATVVAELLH